MRACILLLTGVRACITFVRMPTTNSPHHPRTPDEYRALAEDCRRAAAELRRAAAEDSAHAAQYVERAQELDWRVVQCIDAARALRKAERVGGEL